MLPDALPQLIDTLLRLSHLDAAQLRELIRQLPEPQASAQEMVRRGWITQDQVSSLFPGPQQGPTRRETILLGFADEAPPDPDGEDWSLPLSDEEDRVKVAPAVAWARPDRTDEALLPEPVSRVTGGNEARGRESHTDKLVRPSMRWASIGLLMLTVLLGNVLVWLQVFKPSSTAPPVAPQASNKAKRPDGLLNIPVQHAQPAAPVAVAPVAVLHAEPVAAEASVTVKAPAPPHHAKPKATASLYDRVRHIVWENMTEETERLGIGDIAYHDVPKDGSIMVGMEVTYVPFFTHHVIKSVRAIYQRPDGTRYDGPVCGKPTGVGERVVARPGYAIGGAAIWSGMGIDGVQLTFMEIGPEALNPDKSYLSKWLGGYGGSNAQTFVNDGRPIIGIAGMVSKLNFGPAFCMCLVTTRPGTLADADGLWPGLVRIVNGKQPDDLLNPIRQNAPPPAPQAEPAARTRPVPP
jgi:hypothetical protein